MDYDTWLDITYYEQIKESCGVPSFLYKLPGYFKATSHYKHPWMVLILIQSPEGITQCSGQLIFASWVVTAAQCISRYSIETVKVIYGDYSSVKNESDIKFVYAESLFLHTKYLPIVFKDRKFHLNDLGLLKLALSINLRAHDVGIACLPVPKIFNDPYEPVFASMGHESIMKASLTKKNSSDSDSKDNITLSDYYCCPHFNAKLWKIGWKECIYEIFELFPKRHMNDKGAGMYLRTSRRYLLVGILSFGPNETTICTSPSPIIYFNLEYYLYWIYLIKTNDIDRIRIQFPQERKKDLTTPPPQNTTTQSPIQNQYNLTL
ncbi:chymotrypsin B-like isoform X2 [Lepeophtheirus salmonis]|uniref:chymotrypsin B-like isoform X2 n=1 Tax=Lepeophtheirus salmonis TaxID=72036 RepID=UPI003AF344D7